MTPKPGVFRRHRAITFSRDAGLCVLCGASGTEIDHIDGSGSDPSNLRLLCGDCHVRVTMTHLRPLDAEISGEDADGIASKQQLIELLTRRIDRDTPERDCDRPDWSTHWRGWVKSNAIPING